MVERVRENLPPPQHIAISAVVSTLIAVGSIVVGLLVAGHGWLLNTGELQRQIVINTGRLDRLEEFQRNSITRAEHQELLDRLGRIETTMVSRAENDATDKQRDEILKGIRDEQRQLRNDLSALTGLLMAHDSDMREHFDKNGNRRQP